MTPDQDRLARMIDAWDPETGDLPDEVALAMDGDPELRARFDARFARWSAEETVEPPADLERRVLPVVANRPYRRARWVLAGAALAASLLVVAGVGVGATGGLVMTSYRSELDRYVPVESVVVSTPSGADAGERARSNLETLGYATEGEPMDPEEVELRRMGYIDAPDGVVGMPVASLDGRAGRFAGDAGVAEPRHGNGFADPGVNGIIDPRLDPHSTFSIDVDRGSYSFARRRLREGFLPDPAGVRTEEFVNAVVYDYPQPDDGPFTVQFEASPNPWNRLEHVVRIGVQGRAVTARKPVHLTFLVDTSGSMSGPDRLPLVQQSLRMLVGELGDGDTVALVVYAGSAGVVLPPTPASDPRVLGAIDRLQSGGSTAMGAGLELAYELAGQTLRDGDTSRVIIASDGDANVGVTDPGQLTRMIRGYADRGVTLTTLGFGEGNYQDHRMEQLANDGDGNYFYVDSMEEARRVFVDELASTLEVIAKDVKIQVEWNADAVRSYRLVGYENRAIADRDFRNDRVDAGEIGAGHSVTALYVVELLPGGGEPVATVRLRAKPPGEDQPATERTFSLPRGAVQPSFAEASADHRMAVATATFAERLRGSPYVVGVGYDRIEDLVAESVRPGKPGDAEVLELVRRAKALGR